MVGPASASSGATTAASPPVSAAAAAAPTRQTLPPTRVADSFVAVYYRVISELHACLPDLYGPTSELHHGASFTAVGRAAIADLAPTLPLAAAQAVPCVASVAVQTAANGALLVAVLGSFRKPHNPAAPFAQSFVLEKQSHSHDDHFFCRNDIFLDLDLAPLPGSPPPPLPTNDPLPTAPEKPTPVAPNAPPSASVPIPPAVAAVPPPPPQQSRALPDPVPDLDVSPAPPKPASPVSPAPDHLAPPPAEGATHHDPTLAPNSALPILPPAADLIPDDVTEPTAPPAPPAKKTWASIVSSKEEAAAAAAAAAVKKDPTIAAQAANGTTAPDVPKQTVEDASAQPPVNEQVENIPPAVVDIDSQVTTGKLAAAAAPQTQAPRSGAAMQNGHRPAHMGNRGNQRTFGPTAVVQLGTLNPVQLQDSRALSSELREEFSQYGFKPRHVEVKAQKGLAFIEYESAEGVRAAVAAWANGAREEGAFAGTPLNVSEKRPYNKWRPGSTRGGRGGPRAGRRNRPASTPIS